MARKVLLIACACYPSNAPGAHRPVKMAKYLPEFGWEPVLLCGAWTREGHPRSYDPGLALDDDVCPTFRVPFPPPAGGRLGRAVRRALMGAFPYTSPRGVVASLHGEAVRLMSSEEVDTVWSTYSPGFTHLVAHRLAGEFGIPWVADFRDLPDQVYDSPRIRRNVRQETEICANASAMTTTSRALSARLSVRHRAPVHVVLNGFDPDDYDPRAVPPGDRFDITYYGTLYEYCDPRPLFRALDLLHVRGEIDLDRVAVEFYGPPARQIGGLVRGFACARVVRACGRLPYREMLRRQQRSAVLLLLKSGTSGGAIPLKMLEYLGARRPILNVPGDRGEVDAILEETGSGLSAAEPEGIADTLLSFYREWSSTGAPQCASDTERLARYERREQARRLAGVLDSVVTRAGAAGGRSGGKRGSR
jgi:hypothetical protein